jgi:hypothetical protein
MHGALTHWLKHAESRSRPKVNRPGSIENEKACVEASVTRTSTRNIRFIASLLNVGPG